MSSRYGAQWYKHKDGVPPEDDDNDYLWNGFQWVVDNWEDREEE